MLIVEGMKLEMAPSVSPRSMPSGISWLTPVNKLRQFWEAVQVEFHGQYSVPRLAELTQYYATSSHIHTVLVLVLTPLPSLLTVVLLDLIPLNAPELGNSDNLHFWLRMVCITWIATLSAIVMHQRVLQLPHVPLWRLASTAMIISLGTHVASYAIAEAIGFPVPFLALVAACPWVLLVGIVLVIDWRPHFRRDRTLWPRAVNYYKMLAFQAGMVVIYPIYFHFYRQLSSIPQAAFSMVLPVVKVILKNLMSFFFRLDTDLRPEEIILSIEIFSSLFVTFSMQNSTSRLPMIILTGVDFAHACVSVYDIYHLARLLALSRNELHRFESASKSANVSPVVPFNLEDGGSDIASTLAEVAELVGQMDATRRRRISRAVPRRSKVFRVHPFEDTRSRRDSAMDTSSVVQTSPTIDLARPANSQTREASRRLSTSVRIKSSPRLSLLRQEDELFQLHIPISQRRTMSHRKSSVDRTKSFPANHHRKLRVQQEDLFVLQMLRFLHTTEYIILVEFTEVAIPMIYCEPRAYYSAGRSILTLCNLVCFVCFERAAIYVSVIVHLPNRVYYPQLNGLDSTKHQQLVLNVVLYAMLELLSLVVLDYVVKRRLKFSLLSQLAFVLKNQWRTVQAKLVLWVAYVVQSTLVHYGKSPLRLYSCEKLTPYLDTAGADYTFQFAWLKHKQT